MWPMDAMISHGAASGPWGRGRVDPEGLRAQSQAIWEIQGGPLGKTELASCLCHALQLDYWWPVLGHEAPVLLPIPGVPSAPQFPEL